MTTSAAQSQADAAYAFTFWVLFKRSQEVKGQWVAHCLDLDVVTQGNSLAHAVQMMSEAIGMTLVDDLQQGRNPNDRRAPKECWDEVWEIARRGQRLTFDPQAPAFADVNSLVTVVTIDVARKTVNVPTKASKGNQNRIARLEQEVAFASCGA